MTTRLHSDNATYATLANNPTRDAFDSAAHELYCATMFLAQSDKQYFGKLVEELKNDFTKGNDNYPINMVQAFKLLNKYKNWQPHSPAADASSRREALANSIPVILETMIW